MEKYNTTKALETLDEQTARVKGLIARIENAEMATPVLEKMAEIFNEKKNAEDQLTAVCIGITAIDALRVIDIRELEAVISYTSQGLAYFRRA